MLKSFVIVDLIIHLVNMTKRQCKLVFLEIYVQYIDLYSLAGN